MKIIRFTTDGSEFFCLPDQGPNFHWLIDLIRVMPGVTVENGLGFDSEWANVSKGGDSVRIQSDGRAGIFIRWPEGVPHSQLLSDMLSTIGDAVAMM